MSCIYMALLRSKIKSSRFTEFIFFKSTQNTFGDKADSKASVYGLQQFSSESMKYYLCV